MSGFRGVYQQHGDAAGAGNLPCARGNLSPQTPQTPQGAGQDRKKLAGFGFGVYTAKPRKPRKLAGFAGYTRSSGGV